MTVAACKEAKRSFIEPAAIGLSRLDLLMFGALLTLAFVLRVYNLELWGLWRDELTVAGQMAEQGYLAVHKDVQCTYVDFLFRQPLTRFWHNDLAFRFSSVLWGVASIVMLFSVMRRIEPKAALWVVLLVTLSPTHIRYSQEGRYYIGVYFCTAWLIYQTLRFADRPNLKFGALLALAAGVTGLCKQNAIIVPPLVIPVILFVRSENWKCSALWWKVSAVLAVGFAMAAPTIYQAALMMLGKSRGAYHGIVSERLREITPRLFQETFEQTLFGTHTPMLGAPPDYRSYLVMALMFLGIAYLRRLGRGRMAAGLVVCFFAISGVLFWSYIGKGIPHIRYVIAAVPFANLLAGAGLAALGRGLAGMISELGLMRPAAALRSGFAVTALTTTVFLSCGVAQYYREESKPSHKESIAAASVVSDAIAPVMVTYTDDYSINRAYDMWYINQHPRLKRNIGSVRTDSTTTALEGVLNLASGHKDSIVGIIGSRISSKGDTTLLNAAIQLADSGRAVRLRHFDSCESVFTWSDLIEQPDDVKRLELRAGFLDQLSENWDVEPFKKTFLIHSVREAEVKLAGHNTTKTRELESFILTHSRQELLRAIILQHQERYAEAARSLRIAIDRNPSYPLTYSHLAELYAEWQQRDGGVMLLYRALNAMCEAREAVPAGQLPAWFSNREIYFADQLKTAIIREKSAMPLE